MRRATLASCGADLVHYRAMGQAVENEAALGPGSRRASVGLTRGSQGAQIWLACAAFYYPLFWLSTSLIWTAPALARVALAGYRLEGFSLTAFGASAASAAPGAPGSFSHGWAARAPLALALTMVLVLAMAVLLARVGKRARALSGLAIAVLADVALANGARRLFEFNRLTAGTVLGSVIFFGVMCFGLSWMLGAWPAGAGRAQSSASEAGKEKAAGPKSGSCATEAGGRGRIFLRRFARLLAGFVLLPVLPWLGFSWARGFELWIFALLLMAPAALAAMVASLLPAAPAAEPQWMGWRIPALGLLALAGLAAGVRVGQAKIARARAASTRAAMAAYPELPADAPYVKNFFQKGVSVSAEGWGGYESESGRQMLETLRGYGVNAVALVPYGFAPRGRPEVRLNTGAGSWESDEGIEEMSRVAHALGMKVMLKPGVWVGNGGYAGDLAFASAPARAEWFESYGRFVEHYARLATRVHADLYCVGGEFVKLSPYQADWRKLIARARALYPGPLVYAANFGDEFESVKFWDGLDYIGLQDYYPLPDGLDTGEVLRKVEAVQQQFQRPVILTEVGFASGEGANRTPWEDGRGAPALDLQARCYQAVFKAFYDKPWLRGMYWWKVGTNGFGGPEDTSLTPWGKPAMEVVKQWYTRPGR